MANFNRYITAGSIVNNAAAECGLTPVSNPYASTDPAIVQLRYLLNTGGLELLAVYPWQQLTKEANHTILYGDANTFSLPDDFDRMLDQTSWDRTQNESLLGPVTSQQWQTIKGRVVSADIDITFRYNQDVILVHPDPPAGSGTYADIFYEYISRGWVQDGSVTTTYKDFVEASADLVLFDPLLMTKLLKLRFLGAKGFDTTDISDQVSRAFSSATGKNTAAQVLSVAPNFVTNLQPWAGVIGVTP